ncbi:MULTISPECIES: NUDIX domain-containing protein [unclassified Acinetobacter]|uniref:NUDIX hydrolase n=1 Tax=unclassified Acinetobacter TaxID=196816 RepID=UPI0035B91D91
MAFCRMCATPTIQSIPAGDSCMREVCPNCNHIEYVNPKLICGAIVSYQDKILLCRRAIEPRYGYWTIPAGFMEMGETLEQGALRETWEEAEAQGENAQLYCLYDIPRISQIYSIYRADLKDGVFGVGVESLECALFAEADIPWKELAFPSVVRTLKHYFHDRKQGHFPLHHEVISETVADLDDAINI